MSYMLKDYSSLISLPDISRWDTYIVNDMSFTFSECSSLISLSGISKRNTGNVNDMRLIFLNVPH